MGKFITTHCPSCMRQYHLHPKLLGQKTRCPAWCCREVFVVREDDQPDLEDATDEHAEPDPE